MIGGLQGEFRDLDIKYLKQNILKYPKMSVANIGKLQENTAALCRKIFQNVGRTYREASGEHRSCACKRAAKFRSKRTTFSQPKADFTVVQNLPSAWSDWLPMAVTPSFQLRIMHHLKHWIVDFLSFETTYSMHKLNSRKCSKSG